jgi:hypothetical protein
LDRYKSVGPVAGYVASLIAISLHFFARFVDYRQPRSLIGVVTDLSLEPNKNATKKPYIDNKMEVIIITQRFIYKISPMRLLRAKMYLHVRTLWYILTRASGDA